MKLLVKLIDIIYAIVEKVDECVINCDHELGKYTGEKNTFCYYVLFNKSNRNNRFIKEVLTEIEIIYHGDMDYNGQTVLEEKLAVVEKLDNFLSQFILKVKDRVLKFDYEIGEADSELQVILSFRFMDDVIDLEYNEEQLRLKIENINLKNEVLK